MVSDLISILVIEDNNNIRENTCEILEMAGFHVYCANDGRSGISSALENMPDIILCDIMMPQANGYTVLSELRNNPATEHIPFIFLTASAEKSEVVTGLGMGAQGYIRKPFETVELLQTIRMCLKDNKALPFIENRIA
ncbi:MAG TPA: response regulator [Saprospiraceae bacterium]|nr:response regulator [Saprospiraceae bacterium]